MLKYIISVAILATLFLLVVIPVASEAKTTKLYWQKISSCTHGHSLKVSKNRLRTILRNHTPITEERKSKEVHYRTCLKTKSDHKKALNVWKSGRRWRKNYKHVWPIRFNRLSSYDKRWATSIGNCESGNNPRTNTGNGFEGAMQWVRSTWYRAGGSGSPVNASIHEQWVRAVRWRNIAGTMQWPACSKKLGYA